VAKDEIYFGNTANRGTRILKFSVIEWKLAAILDVRLIASMFKNHHWRQHFSEQAADGITLERRCP
jgi:hypothetical protein